MKWSFKKIDNYCIIDLPNNIFHKEMIESLKEQLKDLSDNEYKIFFLNMGQISKVNSKSLAYIINIYKFAHSYDMEVKLYNLQPYVSQLIYQTRLNQIFDICNPGQDISLDSSINSLMTA